MRRFGKCKRLVAFQPDSGYPKYFGYHPNFRGISEPISDINKLGKIAKRR